MIRYDLRHTTRYRYAQTVSLSQQILRVEPRTTSQQQVLDWTIEIDPEPTTRVSTTDPFGNRLIHLTIERSHHELEVTSKARVALEPGWHPDPLSTPVWESVADICREAASAESLAAARFAYPSHFTPPDDALEAFARESFTAGRPILDAAIHLNERIFNEFTFDADATTVDTMPAAVLEHRRGVCQDFAHLMLAALRSIRLPVRYISGYLLTRPPEGKERLVGADASHAWVGLWVPGSGWIDLDPTNGLLPAGEHITLGWGFDYTDIGPVAGVVYGGGSQALEVAVDVIPI